ncbi:hypothetical protein D3C85_1570810 [compost metagenome]
MISVGVRSSTARDTQSIAFRSTGAARPVSRRPSLWLIISCPYLPTADGIRFSSAWCASTFTQLMTGASSTIARIRGW